MLTSTKVGIAVGVVLIVAGLVTVGVVLGINGGYGNDCEPPKRISTDYIDRNVRVTWDLYQGECNFTYLLRYAVNDGHEIEINTTEFSYTISDVDVCSTLQLYLWTIDAEGDLREDKISKNYTAVPGNAIVRELKLSVVATGIQATWLKPAELFGCDVQYDALYATDTRYISPQFHIDSGNITMPNDVFCFQVALAINVRVGDFVSSSSVISYYDRRELEDITLSVSSNNPNTLVAAWSSHPKEELCHLEYEVLYAPDLNESQHKRVTNPEATFTFTYCQNGNISITIVGSNSTIIGPTITTIDATQYPTNISSVSDLGITTNSESISLSWTAIPSVELCEWIYEIKFWTDIGNFTFYGATSPNEFSGNNYCFFVEVEVRTYYNGEHRSEASRTGITYDLDPVENLELVKSIEGDILTASWIGHRKQEQCDIQYMVTYEHGTTKETRTTNLTTIDFNIVYDTTLTIRVKAISSDKESDERVITYPQASPNLGYTNRRLIPNSGSRGTFNTPNFYVALVVVILQLSSKY